MQVQAFGWLIGGILFVVGLVTYFLAPRVGPNPIFGVRIGYAYASRETWDKTNRLGGGLMALVGIAMALVGVLLQWLNFAPSQGTAALTVVMLITLFGALAGLFVYARNLARGTVIARELTPVKFRWAYLMPVLISFTALVAFAAYVDPILPVEKMATHFNINDQPDGWMSRDYFMVTYLGMSLLFVVLDGFVVFLATREPLIAFGRWGARWRLEPERGLIFVGVTFALVNLILIVVLWQIARFNLTGVFAFPMGWLLWMIVPLIGLIVALFFWLGRRES